MVKKQYMGATKPIGVSVIVIVVILSFLIYFLVFNKADIEKGSDVGGDQESDVMEDQESDVEVESFMVEKGQIVITEGTYYESKGILDLTIWNKGEKNAKISKIVFVSETPEGIESTIETAPSETIDYVFKPDERKIFNIEVSELPNEVWAAPTKNPEAIGILSKENIEIKE